MGVTDITIAGAGLVGLATAFELASRGHAVTVIDPAPLSGASHHAAGMLAPAAEMQYGQDTLVPLMKDSMRLYPDLVSRVEKVSGKKSGYYACGTVVVAADVADRVHLKQLAEFQRSAGMAVEPITMAALRADEPLVAPGLAGAVRLVDDHQVDPRVFGDALLEANRKLGVKFVARKATDKDLGPTTIVATGLGARDLFGWLPLRPVWGDIIRATVPDELQPLARHVVRAFVEDRPVYIVPRQDGRLVIGATSRENCERFGSVGGVHQLLRDAARIIPAVDECAIDEITIGARPGTPDDLPMIGRDKTTGTIISTGYFRHGILLTALAAQLGAGLITDSLEGIDCDTAILEGILANTDPYRWSTHA